jgi:hypothetical protein
MVSYFAGVRKVNNDSAHYYLGYVKKDVDFFPLKSGESWSSVTKVAESAKPITLGQVVSVYICI